jgi:hypothetical protein
LPLEKEKAATSKPSSPPNDSESSSKSKGKTKEVSVVMAALSASWLYANWHCLFCVFSTDSPLANQSLSSRQNLANPLHRKSFSMEASAKDLFVMVGVLTFVFE